MSPPAYSLLGSQAEQFTATRESKLLGDEYLLREWEKDERARADAGIRLRRLLAAMEHRKVLRRVGRTSRAWGLGCSAFAGRHAFKKVGVSLGRFRPLRDQRLQEPALLGFRFGPNTRGEFHACRADIVAPAAKPSYLLQPRVQQRQCAPSIVMRRECLRNAPDPHCCCSSPGRHCGPAVTALCLTGLLQQCGYLDGWHSGAGSIGARRQYLALRILATRMIASRERLSRRSLTLRGKSGRGHVNKDMNQTDGVTLLTLKKFAAVHR